MIMKGKISCSCTGRIFTIHCLSSDWLISLAGFVFSNFCAFDLFSLHCIWKLFPLFLFCRHLCSHLIRLFEAIFMAMYLHSCQVIKSLILDILLCTMKLAENLSECSYEQYILSSCCCCSQFLSLGIGKSVGHFHALIDRVLARFAFFTFLNVLCET